MSRILTHAGAALLLLGLLLAPLTALAQAVSATDFMGRNVSLAAPARRIVALAPHSVENLFSAGAGGALVGRVSASDYPPQALDVPLVGSFNAYSLEAIARAQPDLCLLYTSPSPRDRTRSRMPSSA